MAATPIKAIPVLWNSILVTLAEEGSFTLHSNIKQFKGQPSITIGCFGTRRGDKKTGVPSACSFLAFATPPGHTFYRGVES